MPAGRPIKSDVRQKIVNILYLKNPLCGYDIYKTYLQVYGKVSIRLIYYHLKKGLQTQEIEIAEIRKTRGDYSWGSEAEKIYYSVGKLAKPNIDENVKKLNIEKQEI